MPRYRVPRFAIGPKTSEIILDMGRTLNVGDSFESAKLLVKRRKCGEQKEYVFESYSVCDDVVHFQIPDEFITEEVARGFYDAQVVIDDCTVTNIELVKAPSRYVKGGKSVDSDCVVNDWQEPPCEDEMDECNKCGSLSAMPDGCPNCCMSDVTVLSTDSISKEYLGEEDV